MKIFVEEKDLRNFRDYYETFMAIVNAKPALKNSIIVTQTNYLMGQLYLEFQYHEEAKPLIEESKQIFKQKEQFLHVIECDLYLIAIELELGDNAKIEQFSKSYEKLMEAAKVQGLVMQGRVFGEVQLKIAEKYW